MASDKWAGFTDEDIERIKTLPKETFNENDCQQGHIEFPAKSKAGPMKLQGSASMKQKKFLDSLENKVLDSDFDIKPKYPKKSLECKETLQVKQVENSETVFNNESGFLSDESGASSDHSKETDEKVLESNLSFSELEEFELRQKRIEAENAKRRALLSKAINERKMQTMAEAVKLTKITQELDRLDSILSADVSILRDYIEKATFEFSEAEKRYLKAEKEFVESKLHLFEKMQRKEQLTEHLCAIIEQNENRKADKLVELMKQLEMEAVIENVEESESQKPILSNYCALNNETYHCCQTLKPMQKVAPNTPVIQSDLENTNEEQNITNPDEQNITNPDEQNITNPDDNSNQLTENTGST